MYDQIFDDLERVRRNCETTGDLPFEENAVFDLLENLHPRYGSERSIEIVMGMLEDQKFHDIGGYLNQKDQSSEISNDAKSNDGDSIIEVEVPKKIHPFIDLTNNSPESDGSVVIEKSIVQKIEKDEESESNSSEAEVYPSGGDNDFFDLSDSEPFKNLTDDWNMSSGGLRKSGCAPPLIDFLSLLEEPVKTTTNLLEGDSSISSPAGASEILEENNNDPNNNLDSIILDGESGNANNTSHPNSFSHDSGNECISGNECMGFLDNDGLSQDVLYPSPGCSKYTDTIVNFPVHKNLPHTIVRPPPSPVPGCSKDFESKDDPKQEHKIDKLIKNDADCIKEIMPWADSHTIHCLLDKYRSSSNRKQLALWDLMSQDANQNGIAASKRKFIFDSCEVQTKVSKSERHDNLENHSIETNPGSFHEQKSHHPIPVNSFSDDEPMNAEIPVINHRDSIFGEDTATESSKSKLPMKKGVYPSNGSLVCSVPLMNQDHTLGRLLDDSCNTIESDQESVGRNNDCTINSNNVGASVSLGSATDHDLLSKDNHVGRLIEKTCDEIVTIQQQLESDAGLSLMCHKNIPINTISPKKEGDLRHNKSDILKPPTLILQQSVPTLSVDKKLTKTSYIRPAVLECSTVSHESNAVPMTSVITDAASSKFPFAKGGKTRTPNQVTETTFSDNRPSQVTRIRSAPAVDVGVHAKSELWPKSAASNFSHIKTAGMKLSKQHPSFVSKSNAHRVQPSATVTSSALNLAKRRPPATITSNSNFRYQAAETSLPGPSRNFLSRSPEVPDIYVYRKLRSIFPEVKKSYVRKICNSPPMPLDFKDKDYLLNTLIEHLLLEGPNHVRSLSEPVIQQDIKALSVDEQYEYLLGIFPDADPTYLRDFVEKNGTAGQVIEQFIQQKLETRDYPTKEQYLAKIKVTEQIKQYTNDFNIEKFLELFPDPFTYFENQSRICNYQPIAMEFLKSHFNRNRINTISHFYKYCKYNLSLTAKELSKSGPDMKSKRTSTELLTGDIPLLQELAFIKHKHDIQKHISELKFKENQLFQELKEKNLLLTCQCCYNDECMPMKCSECNVGHLFCSECIIRGTESTLADGKAHVRCFAECESEFPLNILQKILPPTRFSALLKIRQTAELMAAEVDGLVSCPFCHFASIPPPEDKVFKCLNPECMKETCRLCKELNHVPLKCDEVVKTDKARRMIEEKMTEALIRSCYKCKRQFYKEDGCNKMTCPCGALMCYVCDKPVSNYSHFNAQGGANTNLCPLWSDDRLLNAQAVIRVAEDMKKALLKSNPNLRIDTDKLLPKLPQRTKGPHDDIPNANQLPEHVRRVVNAAP